MNRNGLSSVFLVVLVLSCSFMTLTHVNASFSLNDRLQKAASYLISMYNATLGLIANSEDLGPNSLGEEGVPCINTYWVYSDNLWAGWALQPFNESIATNVTNTVQGYVKRYGRSMLFEAAIGEPIPTTIHAKKNIKVYDGVVNGIRVQILLDRHQFADNPGVFNDADEYADLCFYMTITYWMMGDINASMHWFRTGEAMWNTTTNKGFYDKATQTEGRYQNFKLGLFLMAQRVTEFPSDIVETVEETTWSYQNERYGITTQCWLDGSPYGTANTETTAALLLACNTNLTRRLHERRSYAEDRVDELTAEVDELTAEVDELTAEVDELTAKNAKLQEENGVLRNWLTSLIVTTIIATAVSSIMTIRGLRRRSV